MCGIIGYVGNRACKPLLLNALQRLEYRGYDSAGVATLEGGRLTRLRAEGKLKNLEAKLEGSLQETEGTFRLTLSPQDAGRIVEAVGGQVKIVKAKGDTPIVICSPTIRGQFKRLTEANYPDLVVLSYNEIVPEVEIRSSGMISLE